MREDKSKDDLARSVQIWYESLTLKSRQFKKGPNRNLETLEIFKSPLDIVQLVALGEPAWAGYWTRWPLEIPSNIKNTLILRYFMNWVPDSAIKAMLFFPPALFNEVSA